MKRGNNLKAIGVSLNHQIYSSSTSTTSVPIHFFFLQFFSYDRFVSVLLNDGHHHTCYADGKTNTHWRTASIKARFFFVWWRWIDWYIFSPEIKLSHLVKYGPPTIQFRAVESIFQLTLPWKCTQLPTPQKWTQIRSSWKWQKCLQTSKLSRYTSFNK